MSRFAVPYLATGLLLGSWALGQTEQKTEPTTQTLVFPGEKHLKNVTMLTFEGENAEAYFDFSDTRLSFQSTHGSYQCDQIFTMNLDGSDMKLVSTGKGRTTCAYFFPDGKKIIFCSNIGNTGRGMPDFNLWMI
ncbi:MAG: PD40 domain-containing protein, partial [Acidobacteria bacterium]|nr:PD40 domain-containing protein [Acidobacteriota bacterium]